MTEKLWYNINMTGHTIFKLISDLPTKVGVRCVLIGGFAINYYKVTRQTIDIDFIIDKEDLSKVSDYLKKAGFKLDFLHDNFARFKGNDYYLLDVDFMFVDKETLDKIINEGKEASVAGQKFIVPSLNTLIALKLHAIKCNQKLREHKDMPDIISLIRTNKIDYKSKDFRELCLKFGTEDLYNKILSGV